MMMMMVMITMIIMMDIVRGAGGHNENSIGWMMDIYCIYTIYNFLITCIY